VLGDDPQEHRISLSLRQATRPEPEQEPDKAEGAAPEASEVGASTDGEAGTPSGEPGTHDANAEAA
jgi:ribosomal protein S1